MDINIFVEQALSLPLSLSYTSTHIGYQYRLLGLIATAYKANVGCLPISILYVSAIAAARAAAGQQNSSGSGSTGKIKTLHTIAFVVLRTT